MNEDTKSGPSGRKGIKRSTKSDVWIPDKEFPNAIVETFKRGYKGDKPMQVSQLFEQNVSHEFSKIKEDGFFYLRVSFKFIQESELWSMIPGTGTEKSSEYIDVFAYRLKDRIMRPFAVRQVGGIRENKVSLVTLHGPMKGVVLYAGPDTTPPGLPIRVGGKAMEDLVTKVLILHNLPHSKEMFEGHSFVVASWKSTIITITRTNTKDRSWTLHFPNPVIPVSGPTIIEDDLWNRKFFASEKFVPSLLKRFLGIQADKDGRIDFSDKKVAKALLRYKIISSSKNTEKDGYGKD